MGAWEQDAALLREGDFSETDIEKEKQARRADLASAGFSEKETNDYFDEATFDPAPMQNHFRQTLDSLFSGVAKPAAGPRTVPEPTDFFDVIASAWDAADAGWQQSVAGLRIRKDLPDKYVPEDAGITNRIASQIGTLYGDLPYALFGGAVGGALGSEFPVIGNIGGAGAGAMAAPAVMRKMLMDHYGKYKGKGFEDFWGRAMETLWEGSKAMVTGYATAGTGSVVTKGLAPLGKPLVTYTAATAAEVTAMVTVGNALEGTMPKPHHFLDAAIVVGGVSLSTKVVPKLQRVYADTGMKPGEVAKAAQKNIALKTELLSENPNSQRIAELATGIKQTAETFITQETGSMKIIGDKPLPPPERPAAVQKVLSQIGEKAEEGRASYTKDKFYKDFVDRLDPINKGMEAIGIEPELMPTSGNPYKLARMANDAPAKTVVFYEHGTMDFKTLQKNGKSFREIMEPVKADRELLDAYLASQRALEIEAQGKKSGFDIEAATETVKLYEKRFGKVGKELVAYSNRVLEYARDGGLLSPKEFERFVGAGEHYVPFSRLLSPDEGGGGGTKSKPGSFKGLKGSDKRIQSPLLSILENTETIIKLVEKNRAKKALFDIIQEVEGQQIFEIVPKQTTRTEVSLKEMENHLGVEIPKELYDSMSVYRRQTKGALNKNEFDVLIEGERQVIRTEPDIAEAIKSLDGNGAAQTIFARLAAGITAVKKIGITITPEFQANNVFRDQLTAGVFSKSGKIPFTDVATAIGHLLKKDATYWNWMRSGGAQGAFLELNNRYLDKQIWKLHKDTGFLDGAWNTVKNVYDGLKVTGTLLENSTRLAEFKRTSGGASSGDALFEGGYASREVTLDFQRMGAKMAGWNMITAFSNVKIQALDKTIMSIKNDPKGVSTKGLLYITTPSILLWLANNADPRYQEIDTTEKRLYWHIITDDWQKIEDEKELVGIPKHLIRGTGKDREINRGAIYRMPKPGELGVAFGSVPEMILQTFKDENPKAFANLEKTLLDLVMPTLLPDALQPMAEQYSNKNFFTGGPVVPWGAEKRLPALQYNEYTSETAKTIAGFIGEIPGIRDIGTDIATVSSPMVVENYIKSWSGSGGGYVLRVLDEALYKSGVTPDLKPESTLKDIPFIGAFTTRFPSARAASIAEFRTRFQESEKPIASADFLKKTGQANELKQFYATHRADFVKLQKVKDSLTNQGNAIQLIYMNEKMSKEDKRHLIDGLYYMMIQTAQGGVQALDQIDAAKAAIKKRLEERGKK